MYQLDAPIYFYVFTMLPVLWLGYIWISAWKRKAQEQFASSRLMEVLSPERSRLKPSTYKSEELHSCINHISGS